MRRVVSASKRTDIPAFYLRWFAERVAEGFVDVRNPLYRHLTTRVSLRPDDVAWIVFWSRSYGALPRFAARFAAYQLYFQFTINPPDPWLEAHVPPTAAALRQAEWLAARYGGERIAWRYDPIACWRRDGRVETNDDPQFFARVCAELAALGVRRCFTSFADHYTKVQRRLAQLDPAAAWIDPPTAEKRARAAELAAIAAAHGVALLACCEPGIEDVPGVAPGACIDGALLGALGGEGVSTARSSDAQVPGRAACRCTRAVDVGDYERQPCGYGCLYCYARQRHDVARRRR
ncbi:MAG: DUF1848 family protein [Chloroflexi bacterium]|nr:DUF1848 family protein [Chloroflexota bacterium]